MPKINISFHKMVAFYVVLFIFIIMAFTAPDDLEKLSKAFVFLLQFTL